MKLWQGVLVSVLFHAALFLVPVAVDTPAEHPCQDLKFVFVQEGGEGSVSTETQDPAPPDGRPPGPSSQSMHEPVSQPEEPRDTPHVEDEPPVPEDEPVPTMLAEEVPKPPRLMLKKPKRVAKPPPRKKPIEAQSEPKTVSEHVDPAAQPTVQPMGTVPGQGENSSQDSEGHGSTPGSGGPAGHGPVDSSFGSGDGPRFLSKALPRYPRLARELGKEGTVLLRLTIDERGRLLDVQVVKQAGSGFDEEAVRAVRSSMFCPARRGGKPVVCRAHLPIRFVLRSSDND